MAGEIADIARRLDEAKTAMVSAHNHLVEWYVQDQADVIGTVGAIKAAHKTTPVRLIDEWLGQCPRKKVAQ